MDAPGITRVSWCSSTYGAISSQTLTVYAVPTMPSYGGVSNLTFPCTSMYFWHWHSTTMPQAQLGKA